MLGFFFFFKYKTKPFILFLVTLKDCNKVRRGYSNGGKRILEDHITFSAPFLIKFYKALYIAKNKGSTDAKIPKTLYVPFACLPESIN